MCAIFYNQTNCSCMIVMQVAAGRCDDLASIRARIEEVVIKSVLCGLASIRSELRPGRKKEMKSTYNFYKLFG